MRSQIAATLLGLGSIAYGQFVSTNKNGITYKVSIPANTASSKSGDIFLQISGSSSSGWIGLGQGSQMSGANMFIIYPSSSGNNVTLSPRTGSGHSEPKVKSGAQVTLLEGSGISGGVMTANIKCSDCTSNMDVTSSSTNWIYAAGPGSSINSDSTSASISQHGNSYGTMTLDLSSAKNADNTNPLIAATGGTSGTSGCSGGSGDSSPSSSNNGGASPTSSSGGGFFGGFGGSFPTGDDSGRRGPFGSSSGNDKVKRATTTSNACPTSGTNGNAGAISGAFNVNVQNKQKMAHGLMAGLAFAVVFPFGAISIRLLSFPGLVALHVALQILGYLTYIAAFGIGVYLANNLRVIDTYHPIIGILVFVLLFFQPILGFLHHRNFKKFSTRTSFSHAHIWLGRIVITLGIINGGLGFMLADNTAYGPIVYGVVAGIIWCIYVASIVIGERRKARIVDNGPPKYDEAMSTPSGHSVGSRSPVSPVDGAGAAREYYGRRK